METTNMSPWLMGDDMPHKEFMEDNGLVPADFSESLRIKLTAFDVEFAKALEDGIFDEKEYNSLYAFSAELEKLISHEWDLKKGSSGTGAVVGVILAIGAIIGLGKIFRS